MWRSSFRLASAEAILSYLNEAVDEQGLRELIKLNTDIASAEFSSSDQRWHLTTTSGQKYSCSFLLGCMGYYSYENPFTPQLPGQENFKGKIVHPQVWTEECDQLIQGAKVAVIGSGATAVTILPNIADQAEHVTMVQRTPTYIAALPHVRTLLVLLPSMAVIIKSLIPEHDSMKLIFFSSARCCGRLPEEVAS